MSDADMQLDRRGPVHAVRFLSRAHYEAQLVAGYSRNTRRKGLQVFMPDYSRVPRERRYPEAAAAAMRVLLLSMPDSFEHTPALTMRMPNGALASLAGNAGAGHHVAIADLILVQDRVVPTVERLMREHDPDVVGLSVMTFQRRTALRLVRMIRAIKPSVTVVAGGYDPSLAPEAYEAPSSGVDFIVRGEGELTFRALLRALATGEDVAAIPGLSFRAGVDGLASRTRRPRPVSRLEDGELALPESRRARAGRLHVPRPPHRHRRNLPRLHLRLQLLLDHRDARPQLSHLRFHAGAGRHRRRARPRRARHLPRRRQHHLNVARFEALCQAIVDAGLNDIHYIVQAMTSSIASHGDTLAPLMRKAGFRYVFLGIENVLDEDLAFLRASAKNAQREGGRRIGNATIQAIEALHRAGLCGRRRHHRRQSRRHARVDRGQPGVRAADTSTGRTSSTRRRIRARR